MKWIPEGGKTPGARPGGALPPLLALVLAGCAGGIQGAEPLLAEAVGGGAQCAAGGEGMAIHFAADLAGRESLVRSHGPAEGIELAGLPEDALLLLVSMGQRSTGGYGLALAREEVVVEDEVAVIELEFTEPGPDDLVTQALTSPCLLLTLPEGGYSVVRVVDQHGHSRAEAAVPVERREKGG